MRKHAMAFLPALFLVIFINSCAYHLRQDIRNSGAPLIVEQEARFLPDGWSGFLSDYYQGILAIVGDSLFFDCPGRGSLPTMKKISYFSIPLQEIVAIDAAQDAYIGSKIVRIFARNGAYWFTMKNPGPFCESLRPLTQAR
jgi:hypothetical protein